MDENSTYTKVSDFVMREVYACISDMADYLFSWDCSNNKYASYDEWDNMFEPHCPECGSIVEINSNEKVTIKCPYCGRLLDADGMDMYPVEIFEYWLVSPYLGRKLRESGEPVLERCGAWIWGRTCTGQAIALDWVIEKIALRKEDK